MKTLHRKLVREIYQSKGLLLAITSIISIGVMVFVAMQSAHQNLVAAKQRYYRQCRMADFWIDVKKVPVANLPAVASLHGIGEIQPRIQFSATADLPNVSEPINGLVISLPDQRSPAINNIVMKRGDYFTDRRLNEVILNDSFAKKHGLHPGDWIHLLLNNRRQELFVVGTAISAEFTYMLGPGSIVPDPLRFGVFYVKKQFAEDIFDFEGAANQIVGRLSPSGKFSAGQEGGNGTTELLRQAELILEPYGVFATTALKRQASNQFLSSEIDGLGAFATVIPTIFLIVAALVLNVLMTRLVRQQRVVVGTLKALGYSDAQVFVHFLMFGLTVGIVGGVMGSVIGFTLSSIMTRVYQNFFEFPELTSGFYWHTHFFGISVSLLCALAGSSYGTLSVLKLRPAEAMRPEPPKRGGAILLERFHSFWNLLSAGWRMALRGVFRHRVRTLASIFAATMGAGLLVTGFMLIEGQQFFLNFQFHKVTRSDIDVTFKDDRGLEALDEIKQLPGVERAEPMFNVACTFVSGPYQRKGAISGILRDSTLTIPRNESGDRIALTETGVVMSRALADILHIKPGERMTIIPIKGERRPIELVVDKITDGYMGLAVYAEINYLSHLVGEEFAMSSAQLLTDGNKEHLDELYASLKQTPSIQSINTRRAMIDNIESTLIRVQWIFIGMLALFSGAIFFGSIVNASMVNLAERQREVATFLALGYGPWQIGAMFFRESMLTTLAGFIFGLPAGYALMIATAASYDNDLIRFPVVSAPWIWIYTFVLAVVFAGLAQAVVQWTIHRMDYLEALKVKE